MPRCKNCPPQGKACYYTGKENTPRGRGFCARYEKEGVRKKGGNGEIWVVSGNRWVPLKKKSNTRSQMSSSEKKNKSPRLFGWGKKKKNGLDYEKEVYEARLAEEEEARLAEEEEARRAEEARLEIGEARRAEERCKKCEECDASLPYFLKSKGTNYLKDKFDNFGKCITDCEACVYSNMGNRNIKKKKKKLIKNQERIADAKGYEGEGEDKEPLSWY